VFASTALDSRVFADHALLVAGGWTKLLALVVAAVFAHRSTALLGEHNAARLPWGLLAAGLTAYSLGQATLVYFQTFRLVTPFPRRRGMAHLVRAAGRVRLHRCGRHPLRLLLHAALHQARSGRARHVHRRLRRARGGGDGAAAPPRGVIRSGHAAIRDYGSPR